MLLRAQEKICLIQSALRWCSDVPILNTSFSDLENQFVNIDSQELDNAMDLFIDAHLYFLPLPRYSRSFEEDYQDSSIIYKAAKKTLFGLEVEHSLAKVYQQFCAFYPSLDTLRDPAVDLEFQACILCLLALDANSLKSIKMPNSNIAVKKFKYLAFKEIQEEVGLFNTFLDMLSSVSKYLIAKEKAADSKLQAETKVELKPKPEPKTEPKTEPNPEPKLEPKPDPKPETKSEPSILKNSPSDSWSLVSHIKSRGLLLPELEALVTLKVNNDADELHSADVLLASIYVSNIVDENPDFAYKIDGLWTNKKNNLWTL